LDLNCDTTAYQNSDFYENIATRIRSKCPPGCLDAYKLNKELPEN